MIFDVSKQPPRSILTSTITAPSFIVLTVSSETITGDLSLPRIEPMAISHLLKAFATVFG